LGSQIVFNGRLAFVAQAGAVVLGLVLAVLTAWLQSRGPLLLAMQSESRSGTASLSAQRLRHMFVVAQIALAFVLLSGAGLLGISLQNASQVSPGFQASHVLSGQISLPRKIYPSGQTALAFTEQLTEKMESQPGVLAAGVSNNVPFSGHSGKSATAVKGYIRKLGEAPRGNYSYGVGGDYFSAMGFSLKAGRFLTAADSRRAERVCVIDEDFARYYWPDTSPLGRQLYQGSEEGQDAEAFTVVGVVGRVQQAGLTDEEAQGAVYYPYLYRPDNDMFVVIRSSLPAESMAPLLRRIVRQVDSNLPVNDVQSMDARISDSLVARRSPALLAALFSAIALLLTAVGTYGVLSYSVAQRRREIGVRMALGAQPRQIGSQFLYLALRLLACGTTLGIAGAWLAGRAMQSVLFHVQAFHVPTLTGTAAVMGIVSLVACLLPSYRATRISPVETLSNQ
jgi:predicted permease